MGNAISANIRSVCKRHGSQIKEFSASWFSGFFRAGHKSKDYGFPVAVRTGEEVITPAVLPTSDVYLGENPHHAHAIAAMAAMTRVSLKVAMYIGNGDFYYALPSDIRVYTSAEQRDSDVM